MSTEMIMTETFAAHEYLAPPAHELWPGIERGIRTRRRKRAAVAAFAAVAVVASGVAVAGGVVGGHGPAAGPKPGGAASSGPTTGTGSSAPASIGTLTIPVESGWLPPGARETDRWVMYDETGRMYEIPHLGLIMLGSGAPDMSSVAPARPTTLNGKPATEWLKSSYVLHFLLPSGKPAWLAALGFGMDGTQRRAVARRVAESMTDGHHVLVQPLHFTISALPPGLAIRGVGNAEAPGTEYTLGRPGVGRVADFRQRADQEVHVHDPLNGSPKVGQVFFDPTGRATKAATAGRPVQGHKTTLVTWDHGWSLFIPGLVPGHSIRIDGGSRVSTLAQLYALADSIRLAH